MNEKIKTEILYYTGYTLQIFLNQFNKLLDEYENGKTKDDSIEDDTYYFINENNEPEQYKSIKKTLTQPIIKYNVNTLFNLIRITNNFLNSKPHNLKIFYDDLKQIN